MLTEENLIVILKNIRRLDYEDSEGQPYRFRIYRAINPFPLRQRLIITGYYVDGLNWEQLSRKMGLSPSQCKRIRNKGIESLLNVFNDAHDTISPKTAAGNL